ncbi:MAG: hypothetical protein Q9178_007244 [Gyalolechia marmorata]
MSPTPPPPPSHRHKTIQIIGSLNIDLITRTPRLPAPGETLPATSFTYGSGGKGANQAVACARLSRSKKPLSSTATDNAIPTSTTSTTDDDDDGEVEVYITGSIGSDFFGEYIISQLTASGVNVSGVRTVEGEKTGTAIVLVEEGSGENRILITRGANDRCCVTSSSEMMLSWSSSLSFFHDDEAEDEKKEETKRRPDMIILQLEIPLETVVEIIKSVKEKGGGRGSGGVDILLNPAPAPPDGLPSEVYEGLTHLIMNETEAAMLAKEKVDNNRQDQCEIFHAKGVQNVIITLGSQGVYYSFRNYAEGWGEGGHIPAAGVERVVDTTAAGDTFVGAYAVAIVNGASVVNAVKWANKASAKTVEREGSMESIPWRNEVGGAFP